jgi:hypothetical protein
MILRERGIARDAAAAALDTTAALRFLAAAGVTAPRLWVAVPPRWRRAADAAAGSTEAWSRGVAVVRVAGRRAERAAIETAASAGATATTEEPTQAGGDPTTGILDGARLAARFEVGLFPDEVVELVLDHTGTTGLEARLEAFDRQLAAAATPRRLVLAGMPEHGPHLSAALVAAIVHPLVLVELTRSDAALLTLLRRAADEVVEPA